MSHENVEVVESLYEAVQWVFTDEAAEAARIGSSDPDEAIRRFDPVKRVVGFLAEDVVWEMIFTPAPVVGHRAVVQTISEWIEVMADWKVVDTHFTDAGEDLVLGEATAIQRGRGSGVPTEQTLFIVYEVKAGKIAHYKEYLDRGEALEAVGLAE